MLRHFNALYYYFFFLFKTNYLYWLCTNSDIHLKFNFLQLSTRKLNCVLQSPHQNLNPAWLDSLLYPGCGAGLLDQRLLWVWLGEVDQTGTGDCGDGSIQQAGIWRRRIGRKLLTIILPDYSLSALINPVSPVQLSSRTPHHHHISPTVTTWPSTNHHLVYRFIHSPNLLLIHTLASDLFLFRFI